MATQTVVKGSDNEFTVTVVDSGGTALDTSGLTSVVSEFESPFANTTLASVVTLVGEGVFQFDLVDQLDVGAYKVRLKMITPTYENGYQILHPDFTSMNLTLSVVD